MLWVGLEELEVDPDEAQGRRLRCPAVSFQCRALCLSQGLEVSQGGPGILMKSMT